MAGTFSDDKFTFDTIEIEENFLSLLKVNLISNEDASNELSAIFFNDNNNTTKVISEKILTEFTKIVKRKYVNKNKDKKQAFSYEALSANMAKVSSKSYAYEYVPNYYDFLLENKCSKITPQVLNPWTGYHFGEQISNAQIELDLQIEKMSRKYMESFGIQEFQRFKSISEETLTVVGRIIIDEKDEHSDTYLENISDSVALNLSMLREYNLFSGQVVIAKGSSDSFTFFAKEIATEINLDYEDRDERLWEVNEMSVVFAVACGPYTDSENLEYGPLIRFMENISDKVNSLILIGPLVDAENKMILRGHVNSQMFGCTSGRYEDLFDNIMKYIKSRFKEVIIVPSYREMTHFYPLPQLPYDGCIAPGPCTLKIKDVSIGVVPYDLWKHVIVNSHLKSASTTPTNKIHLASHQIIHQLNYMPLYPIEAIPVEYAHYSKFLIENPPNIIITSSNMALTHYKESDTLCVNVQTLLKTPGQITYGLFNIQPPQIQDRIAFKLVKDSFN